MKPNLTSYLFRIYQNFKFNKFRTGTLPPLVSAQTGSKAGEQQITCQGLGFEARRQQGADISI